MTAGEKVEVGEFRQEDISLRAAQDVEAIEAPVTWKAYLLCAFASFGGIFFGYDSGYINGVTASPIFYKAVEGAAATKLSDSNSSLIVSILSCGTFFGALIAGDMADWIGRKWTVILGCVIYAIGVAVQMITSPSHALGPIVAGRLVAGLGVGFESAIVILYMSEIVGFASSSKHHLMLTTPTVPPQGPWCSGLWLPVLHHHWPHAGFDRRQLYLQPRKHQLLPHSHWHPVSLGFHSRRWSPVPSRVAQVLHQEGYGSEGCFLNLQTPRPA